MSDAKPPLNAYVVTLFFGEGMVHIGTAMSFSPQEAVAVITIQCLRHHNPASDLMGVGCLTLPPEWLRAALAAVETGKPMGEVLSLVPKAEPDPDAA